MFRIINYSVAAAAVNLAAVEYGATLGGDWRGPLLTIGLINAVVAVWRLKKPRDPLGYLKTSIAAGTVTLTIVFVVITMLGLATVGTIIWSRALTMSASVVCAVGALVLVRKNGASRVGAVIVSALSLVAALLMGMN